MSRRYVLEIVLCPRKSNGAPAWADGPSDYLYELASRRGLPHAEAMEAAGRKR